MAATNSRPMVATRGRVRAFLRAFPQVHLGIGLVGNVAFVVGSVLFLFQDLQTGATWLFIVGSTGLLVRSLGQALARHERTRLQRGAAR